MANKSKQSIIDDSSSEEELPPLDELLLHHHAATVTGRDVSSKSLRKSPAKSESPIKRSQSVRGTALSEGRISFAEDDSQIPSLKPTTGPKAVFEITQERSPDKHIFTGPDSTKQKIERPGRRQRALKSPVKSQGLLFKPIGRVTENDAGTYEARVQARNDLTTRPFLYDSDEESELSQEVDIFKGTGILRKTPRRAIKRDTGYKNEDLVQPSDSEKENRAKFEISQSMYGTDSAVDDSESDNERFSNAGLANQNGNNPLNISKSLSLDPPQAMESPEKKPPRYEGIKSRPQTRTGKKSKSQSRKPSHCNVCPCDTAANLPLSPPTTPSLSMPSPKHSTPPHNFVPPVSPGKLRSPSKIKSPTKTLTSENGTTGRPSLDAFWSQDLVNDVNEQRSPTKTLTSPRKQHLIDFFADRSDEEVEPSAVNTRNPSSPRAPPKQSPQKRAGPTASKEEKVRIKAFDARKDKLARDFLCRLDTEITKGEIARLTVDAGGVQIIWSKKLNSTAGRAHWRRERRVPSAGTTPSVSSNGTQTSNPSLTNVASIELASKVVDNETRLYNVLAHEFCHLANFMVSCELKQPHGASFQAWARKATAAFGSTHRVKVTTKHDYAIAYKYVWMCVSEHCRTEYKRHSKSIDVQRHTCGKCKGRLVQLLPRPRGGAHSPIKGDDHRLETVKSAYSLFVKEQFRVVKEGLPPGSPAKEVMREVAVR